MDTQLLDMLTCPASHQRLIYVPERSELVCMASQLAYPVRDGVPVMLISEARTLNDTEIDSMAN